MPGGSDLIDYYRGTHARRVYGTSSVKYVRYLRPEIRLLRPRSILDYGCGQSLFLDCLDLDFAPKLLRYDPAIAAYAEPPAERVDLLVCIDVLEHVEECDLDDVLAHMAGLCRHALIVVDTRPAKHTLPDGRNAHVTLHEHAWWRERLGRHFAHLEPVATPRRSRAGFRTWARQPGDARRYRLLRAREDTVHYALRLVGRHKTRWKVSATRKT